MKDPTLYSVSEKLYRDVAEEAGSMGASVCYVLAPVMCLYVAWVLREAAASGKRRLYFLARDGYSMYETAKLLCRGWNLQIECRYLYCSRYAWRSAEYHFRKEEALDYICLGGIDVTFRRVMCRAGLSGEEGKAIARLLGWERKYDIPLGYRQVKALRPLLAECAPFMDKMAEKSAAAYPSVCGYLRQEGLLDGTPWALVDSGWVGSLQKSLQNLLGRMGYKGRVEGYYFGMYAYPQGVERDAYHSWYFGPESGMRRKVYFSNSLFECIFSSPEGMAKGYVRREDGYRPVFEKPWNPNRDRIEKSTGYLRRYAGELAGNGGKDFLAKDGAGGKIVFSLFRNFMGTPSLEEAREFGSYIFCDDVIGETVQTVAADLTAEQIRENRFLRKAAVFFRKKGKNIRESAWMEGSIVLGGVGKGELLHCAAGKYMLYLRKLAAGMCHRLCGRET